MIRLACGCGRALETEGNDAPEGLRCPACGQEMSASGQEPPGPPPLPIAVESGWLCVECGTAVPPKAYVCPGCGVDLRTGTKGLRIPPPLWPQTAGPPPQEVAREAVREVAAWLRAGARRHGRKVAIVVGSASLLIAVLCLGRWGCSEMEEGIRLRRGYHTVIPGVGKLVGTLCQSELVWKDEEGREVTRFRGLVRSGPSSGDLVLHADPQSGRVVLGSRVFIREEGRRLRVALEEGWFITLEVLPEAPGPEGVRAVEEKAPSVALRLEDEEKAWGRPPSLRTVLCGVSTEVRVDRGGRGGSRNVALLHFARMKPERPQSFFLQRPGNGETEIPVPWPP